MSGRRSWLLRTRREARGLSTRTLILQAFLLGIAAAVLAGMLLAGRAPAFVPSLAIALLAAGLLVAVVLELLRRR